MTGRCMVACAVLALLSAFAGENAHADGKMYVREKVPADIPYQRAVIAHDGTHELLILQSKFTGDAKEFAWVVPIPSNPKLGCIAESREAEALFRRVSSVSRPEVIRMGPLVLPAVGLIIILTGIIVYVRDTRKRRMEKLPSPMVSRGFVLILVGLFFALFAVAIPSLTMARSAGVEVLQSTTQRWSKPQAPRRCCSGFARKASSSPRTMRRHSSGMSRPVGALSPQRSRPARTGNSADARAS
jgi:hypothetical protein